MSQSSRQIKQQYDFDCGHTCLEFLGFARPTKNSALVPQDIKDILGTRSDLVLNNEFIDPGIYMIAKNAIRHWVIFVSDRVYDPFTGTIYSHADYVKLKHDYLIMYRVNINDSKQLQERILSPAW